MSRSIRFRVTVLATATTAVIVFAFGWLLTELVRSDLVQAGEEALGELAEDVDGVSLVAVGESGAEFLVEGEAVVAAVELDDDGDLFAELFAADDDPSEPIGAFVLDTGTGEIRQVIEYDDGLARAELELATEDVAEQIREGAEGGGEQLEVIRAAEDVFVDVADGVDASRRAAWRIGPILVTLTALITWFVVGRALAPTRQIAAEANSIDSDSLDQRLSRSGDGTEVDTIARVINEMLDRIEGGVRREQQFVADASHELRTPLATTRMAAELAADDAPGSPYPSQVVEEVDRMQALIDDLLELARTDRAQPMAPVRLGLVVREVVDGHAAADIVSIDVDIDAEVLGREAELRRVVVNLLDNAHRFADRSIEVSLRRHGDSVDVTVDDDGPGISVDDRDRVFDRFARLDEGRGRNDGGSGLGLAIVAAIAERHGGRATASEAPSGGARIVVRLPLAGDS